MRIAQLPVQIWQPSASTLCGRLHSHLETLRHRQEWVHRDRRQRGWIQRVPRLRQGLPTGNSFTPLVESAGKFYMFIKVVKHF